MPEEIKEWLRTTYSLADRDILRSGMCWNETDTRLATPIRDAYKTVIGWSYRKLDPKVPGPKSIIDLFSSHAETAVMSWYPMMIVVASGLPVLLVEDQISALKASSHIDAIALLGTNLSETKVNYLLKAGVKRIIVALDKDASVKASTLVKQYSSLFSTMTFLPLERDIKDLSDYELTKLLDPLT